MMRQRTLGVLSLVATTICVGAFDASAQDSDGDGTLDNVDTFPCDLGAVAEGFAPAQGVAGVLLFEDQWPARGDFDFNDVVVGYQYAYKLDALGQVTALQARFTPVALGGLFDNGLALRLAVPKGQAQSILRSVNGGSAVAVTPSATDSDLVVTLSTNLRELHGGLGGQINSLFGQPHQAGGTIDLTITFSVPVTIDIADQSQDLFIFRSGNMGLQIHRPEFGGTAAMDTALFGTLNDRSTPAAWFMDSAGVPFALEVSQAIEHPLEATDIASLYPDILAWAASGGASLQDWYTRPVTAFAYSSPPAPAITGGPSFAPDLSCACPSGFTGTAGSCVPASLTFSVMGDVPYSAGDVPILLNQIAAHNAVSPSKFVMHVGDIKSGGSACVESVYINVASYLHQLTTPTFIVPGDNEWNDCSNVDQAFSYWQTHFSNFESYWPNAPVVSRMAARPENMAWVDGRVLLIAVSVPGGRVWSTPLWNALMTDAADWLTQQFALHGNKVDSVVIMGHAILGSKHSIFSSRLIAEASAFVKPVLYIHGDGHVWRHDRPFAAQNILRVEVDSGGRAVPVQVTVDASAPTIFSFDRTPF